MTMTVAESLRRGYRAFWAVDVRMRRADDTLAQWHLATETRFDAATGTVYRGVLEDPGDTELALFSGRTGGLAKVAYGELLARNSAGELDALLDPALRPESVRVRLGAEGVESAQWIELPERPLEAVRGNADGTGITMRPKAPDLSGEIVRPLYRSLGRCVATDPLAAPPVNLSVAFGRDPADAARGHSALDHGPFSPALIVEAAIYFGSGSATSKTVQFLRRRRLTPTAQVVVALSRNAAGAPILTLRDAGGTKYELVLDDLTIRPDVFAWVIWFWDGQKLTGAVDGVWSARTLAVTSLAAADEYALSYVTATAGEDVRIAEVRWSTKALDPETLSERAVRPLALEEIVGDDYAAIWTLGEYSGAAVFDVTRSQAHGAVFAGRRLETLTGAPSVAGRPVPLVLGLARVPGTPLDLDGFAHQVASGPVDIGEVRGEGESRALWLRLDRSVASGFLRQHIFTSDDGAWVDGFQPGQTVEITGPDWPPQLPARRVIHQVDERTLVFDAASGPPFGIFEPGNPFGVRTVDPGPETLEITFEATAVVAVEGAFRYRRGSQAFSVAGSAENDGAFTVVLDPDDPFDRMLVSRVDGAAIVPEGPVSVVLTWTEHFDATIDEERATVHLVARRAKISALVRRPPDPDLPGDLSAAAVITALWVLAGRDAAEVGDLTALNDGDTGLYLPAASTSLADAIGPFLAGLDAVGVVETASLWAAVRRPPGGGGMPVIDTSSGTPLLERGELTALPAVSGVRVLYARDYSLDGPEAWQEDMLGDSSGEVYELNSPLVRKADVRAFLGAVMAYHQVDRPRFELALRLQDLAETLACEEVFLQSHKYPRLRDGRAMLLARLRIARQRLNLEVEG